jgi:hypothetical protein
VDEARAGRREARDELDRIPRANGDAHEVAALEPHGFAVQHVDGRNHPGAPNSDRFYHRVSMLT